MNDLNKVLEKLKTRRSITYKELNDLLPDDIILEEHIEEIIQFFDINNITIKTGKQERLKTDNKYDKEIIIDNLIDTPDKFYFYEMSKNKKITMDKEKNLMNDLVKIKDKIKTLLLETDFFFFELFKDIIKTKKVKTINFFFDMPEKQLESTVSRIKTLFKIYISNKKEPGNKVSLTSFLQQLKFKFTYIADKIKLLKQIHQEITNPKTGDLNKILKKAKRKKINSHLIDYILPELNYLLNKYENTKKQLINNQLPIVISITRHYINENCNYNDLIQEGNIAMIEALDYYDPLSHKKEFNQFVSSWIRNKVKQFIGKNKSLLTFTPNFQKECKIFLKTARKIKNQLLRTPTIKEINADLNWPDKKIKSVIKYLQNDKSLEEEDKYTNLSLREAISDRSGKLPEDIAIEKILKEQVTSLLNQLGEKEKFIIKMRFGLNNEKKNYDYKEIARKLQLTENEIKNIEEHSLKKLKVIFKKNNIDEFI